jgi:serine/threonine protein kinase
LFAIFHVLRARQPPIGEGRFFVTYIVEEEHMEGTTYVAKVLKPDQDTKMVYQEAHIYRDLLHEPSHHLPRFVRA